VNRHQEPGFETVRRLPYFLVRSRIIGECRRLRSVPHLFLSLVLALAAEHAAVAMDRSEYYASVRSVLHGLDPEFRRFLERCGAEASVIVELEADAAARGALSEEAVSAFLSSDHFGESVLYCLNAKIEAVEPPTDDPW
jgi:hypothetical protein